MLAAFLVLTSARAQLDLPTRLDAPPLTGETYLAYLRDTLDREVADLAQRERAATSPEKRLLRASISVRLVALQILGNTEGAEPRDGATGLAGLRLVYGRRVLDTLIRDIGEAEPMGAGPSLEALDLFNANVIDHATALREADFKRLDAILPHVLAPLARAATGTLPGPPVDHWPRRHGDAAAAEAARAADPARFVESLAQRVAESAVSEDLREPMDAIVGYLRRGVRYPEFAHAVDRLGRRLASGLDVLGSIDAASWMSAEQSGVYLDVLRAAVIALLDPAQRMQGERRLTRLEHSRVAIARITELRGQGVEVRPLAAGLYAMDAIALDAATESPPPSLHRLTALLDHMLAIRALRTDDVPRDMRPVVAKLERAYRGAERSVIDELAALADDETLADPAFMSLVVDHAQHAEDLARLHRLPSWLATMDRLNPRAAVAVRNRLKRTAVRLTDAGRRPDAVRLLDRFETRLAIIDPFPFETELEAGGPAAIVATGGLHREMLETIRAARRDWVDAWARGDDEESAAVIDGLARLTRLMAESADVLDRGATTILLDRWSAWELPRRVARRAASDLPNRLKLATVAATGGRFESLTDQLDRIERDAPLVRLIGGLERILGADLAALPDGAQGLLGRLVHPPSPDARLRAHRLRLAELCRYTVEADYAWAEGREDSAEALQAYVNWLAEQLMLVLTP